MKLTTLLPSSIEGLMGLWEEHLVSSIPLKGLDVIDDSPFYSNGRGSPTLSTAPQGCKPESMRGTLQGGEEVRLNQRASL